MDHQTGSEFWPKPSCLRRHDVARDGDVMICFMLKGSSAKATSLLSVYINNGKYNHLTEKKRTFPLLFVETGQDTAISLILCTFKIYVHLQRHISKSCLTDLAWSGSVAQKQ